MKKVKIYTDRWQGQDLNGPLWVHNGTNITLDDGNKRVMFVLLVPEDHELWPPDVDAGTVQPAEVVT